MCNKGNKNFQHYNQLKTEKNDVNYELIIMDDDDDKDQRMKVVHNFSSQVMMIIDWL